MSTRLRSHPRVTWATIPPQIIRYLTVVAAEGGLSLDRKLAAVGLPADVLSSIDLRISYRQGREVIEHALDLMPRPGLGLAVGARQPVTASGIVGLGMLSSATVAEAIELGITYQNLGGSMVEWSMGDDGGRPVVEIRLPSDRAPDRVDAFLLEEAFSSVTQLARSATSPRFRPHRVEFVFSEPADPRLYRDFFDCDVRFGATRNRWLIDSEWYHAALPGADRWTHLMATRLLESQVERYVDRQELVELVELRVERALPDVPTLTRQAAMLALSERTLRRRLSDIGTSYSDIVDGVRQRVVGELLTSPALTVTEIAYRSGFSDERAARRAIRRWFGQSSAQLRARLREQDAGAQAPLPNPPTKNSP